VAIRSDSGTCIMTLSEIVVVSGSYGAGHDAAADALAERLRSTGQVVRRLDVAEGATSWRLEPVAPPT